MPKNSSETNKFELIKFIMLNFTSKLKTHNARTDSFEMLLAFTIKWSLNDSLLPFYWKFNNIGFHFMGASFTFRRFYTS